VEDENSDPGITAAEREFVKFLRGREANESNFDYEGAQEVFNSHIFDFHEGWMYVFGVGVAGGLLKRQSGYQLEASGRSQRPLSDRTGSSVDA
jgi:hypothetical protein